MHVLGILAATSLSLGLLLAPGPAPAPAVEPAVPSIADLTVDPGPFRVDGVARSAAASISVDIVDPYGVTTCEDRGGPFVRLTRTAGGRAVWVPVSVRRVAGTPQSGTYIGVWHIASTRAGVWTVTAVWWCNSRDGSDVAVYPPEDLGVVRTITVIGTNLPRVTTVRVPSVAMWGSPQEATVSFSTAAGRPLANRKVHVFDWDYGCGYEPEPRTTSSQGRITVRLPARWRWSCLRLATDDGRAVLFDVIVWRRERFASVGAVPDSSVIPRSGTTAVRGSVAPSEFAATQVRLLRRAPSGWSVVARARARDSGRYTLLAPGTSAARGRHEYRVVASTVGATSLVPTTSRTFVLTGR